MAANSTVGMFIINNPLHGKCTNLDAIEDIKQCGGTCQSSTYFNKGKQYSIKLEKNYA